MSKNNEFIRVKGLHIQMGDSPVLDDINFTIREGEGFGILGKSGSGKSVLMHAMRGTKEYRPEKGSIIYNVAICPDAECRWIEPPSRVGKACSRCGRILEFKEINLWECDKQLYHEIHNRLSMMTQRTFAIYGESPVIKNIEEALKDINYPKEKRVLKIMQLLKRVELVHRSLHIARDLSGGEKQRVVLARALALDPITLYADEPTGTLDPITADTVHRVLRQEIENGMTMVVTSHWLHALEELTDHGIVLQDGKIIAAGRTGDISDILRGEHEEFERGEEVVAELPKVKIENCSKSFYVADRGGMVHAVSNLNLTINTGEIFGIVGVSGAGKTTLGKMIAGLQTTSSGRIMVRIGDDWIDMNIPGEHGRGRATPYISILHQEYGLYPHSTVVRNLTDSIGIKLPAEIARMKAGEILKMVGFDENKIDDILDAMPDELGVGEQHRIALARGLMTEPEVLILDEPTGTIDPITLNDVIKAILRSRKELNQTYIIMSHDTDFVKRVCDRAILMSGGELIEIGSPDKIVDLFKKREQVMGA